MQDGQLGEVFLIATERVGPFPDRVRDVGVVKDLATHDLDLVRWLGGAPIERLAAQTQHRMGREHEDLVLVTGRLESAVSFNCVVDWLSPAKVRRTRVLGELGHARRRHAHRRPHVLRQRRDDVRVGRAQALRGVSEGDATRYALARREPLLVELEAFCDLLAGDPRRAASSRSRRAWRPRVVAEAVLASAATGETVRPAAEAAAG